MSAVPTEKSYFEDCWSCVQGKHMAGDDNGTCICCGRPFNGCMGNYHDEAVPVDDPWQVHQ